MTVGGEARAEVGHVQGGEAGSARAVAFAELVREQLDESYRLAGVLLGSHEEGEDATQDALERAWRRWDSLRDPARARPWFTSILLNACRDRMRNRRVVAAARSALVQPSAADASDAALARRDLLERAFEHLSPDHRIALTLRYYLDLSLAEIASRIGVPEGTVKSRLHQAEQRLRTILEAEEARS